MRLVSSYIRREALADVGNARGEVFLNAAIASGPACTPDNPRKRAETLRRAPRRSKTATGTRQHGAPPAQGVRRDQPIKPA